MVEQEYTDEQLSFIKRIKNCKNYYEILEVDKDASDLKLKKKYRKLALALHPDKNKAPGAIEAFKAVGNAFAVLSDKEKRKQYDLCGEREPQATRTAFYSEDRFSTTYDFSRGFEADVTANELFNLFFGGGFPATQLYVRRNNRTRNARHNQESMQNEPTLYSVLIQMMVILFLIVLSFMSSYLSPELPYSLVKKNKYVIERTELEYGITYYVKENFLNEYKGNIKLLESNVVEEYIATLKSNCRKERSYKESMLWRARTYRDYNLEKNARGIKTPSCERLAKFVLY